MTEQANRSSAAAGTEGYAPAAGDLPPFRMERWQSLHEHRVRYNLSDSGVHPLTLGELRELADVAVDDVRLGYVQTNGSEELRERVAALHPGAGAANVLVTTGSAEANYLALWELLGPGDRVAIIVPTYGQTPGLARSLGARVDAVRLEESRGWQPAPGAVEDAVTPETRLVVVTNPNNPTGARLTPRAREEIVAAAERAGAWILADEVYAGAELDGDPTPSFWGACPRTLVTGSLSKAYGLPGLRLGWVVAPAGTVERLWARKDYTTIAPAALSEGLAAAALHPDVRPRILARTRRILNRNVERLGAWLDAHRERFSCRRPEAGAICYVRYALETGSEELADRLRREESVLVVPGAHFEMERYLRLGFGNPEAELEAALDRVARLVERVGPS